MSRRGGFRTELSKQTGLTKEQIPGAFAQMYHMMDSMEVMGKRFMPLLIEAKSQVDVGIKVNRVTDRVSYLHVNGRIYRAFRDNSTQHYYFINEAEEQEWCK